MELTLLILWSYDNRLLEIIEKWKWKRTYNRFINRSNITCRTNTNSVFHINIKKWGSGIKKQKERFIIKTIKTPRRGSHGFIKEYYLYDNQDKKQRSSTSPIRQDIELMKKVLLEHLSNK